MYARGSFIAHEPIAIIHGAWSCGGIGAAKQLVSSQTTMHPYTTGQDQARRGKFRSFAVSILIAPALLSPVLRAQAVTPPPEPAKEAAKEEPVKLMEFFVSEKGLSRANNAITPQEFKISLPGVTVEKLLAFVPGVNVVVRDPFGFYESGNDIRVRSFDITRLAITVDDVPMGNNSTRYGSPSGRIIDGENLANIEVSQGTGDVTTPAYEALGGSIKYYSANPSKEMGITLKQAIGDFDLNRNYQKINFGEILPGLTAYVSHSDIKFKTAGIPKDSEGERIEAKVLYRLPKATLTLGYTWNDRDDYDTRSIQYDRYRALETGVASAAYGAAAFTSGFYSAASRSDLNLLASRGYSNFDQRSGIQAANVGDYSDRGRRFSYISTLDSTINQGDGANGNLYYKYWRNGRMDSFLRGTADITVTEAVALKVGSYYQDKNNYGTGAVTRGDARTQIVNAYSAVNNPKGILRTDIYPRWAYRDTAGNLVPFGTPGAIPVGYTDTNGNGFMDVGETLNAGVTPTAFSNAHALIAPTSTTLANATSGMPGATGRDEDFGGYRYGINPKVTWTAGANKLTGGFWYEIDQQSAIRPTYNLSGGNSEGYFLYDQLLFNNYQQNFNTKTSLFFLEESHKFFDNQLTLSAAAKSLTIKREADGILYTNLWWLPLGSQQIKRQITYKDSFLPQLGASYNLTPKVELFANYAENLASPQLGVIANIDFNENLMPETAKNYDAGIRYSSRSFGSSFSIFYNRYENRILSIAFTTEELAARGLAGVTGATQFRNVGAIDSTGAEFTYDWRTPIKGLRINGAFAYQKSIFADNILVPYAASHSEAGNPFSLYYQPIPNPAYDPTSTDPTKARFVKSWELDKDKSQGNTPKLTANATLAYTWNNIDMNFGGRFFDSVFVNTLNTEKLPSYVVYSAGLTYRGQKGTKFAPFKASVTVDNVFDKYYFTARGYTGAFNGSVGPGDYGRNIVFTVEASF